VQESKTINYIDGYESNNAARRRRASPLNALSGVFPINRTKGP
jgi:hypothetical protein